MKKTKSKLDYGLPYYFLAERYLAPYRIKFCTQFLKLHPKHEEACSERAHAYCTTGKYVLAIKDYTKALRIKPHADTYLLRAGIYTTLRQYKKAVKDLNKAIQLRQKTGGMRIDNFFSMRAECYIRLKKFNRAIKDLKRAIRYSERKDFYYARIAELYSSNKDEKIRDGKKAIDYAKKAIASLNEFRKKKNLPKQESSHHLSVLAAAYAQLGKFNDAIRTQKKAIALLRDADALKIYKHSLNLYKQKLPFIEE